jgi:poly-gamma-glutamate synthesis protein (capsule biosynthesis protein)
MPEGSAPGPDLLCAQPDSACEAALVRRIAVLLLALVPLLLPSPAQAVPPYHWSSRTIDSQLAARMHYSYHQGCPVPLRDLRYLQMSYLGWYGQSYTGEMVVHKNAVTAVANAFNRMYDQGFRIRRMKLVDDYKGSDDASMYDDNTSAFNCRTVVGGSGWSMHAYGLAVDINPVENPYVLGSQVKPPNGRPFVTRSPVRKGMVTRGVVEDFRVHHWGWGGYFTTHKDWQHFSSNGR